MLIFTWKLSVLIFLLSDQEAFGYEEKVTISRHYLGDMFFGHGKHAYYLCLLQLRNTKSKKGSDEGKE